MSSGANPIPLGQIHKSDRASLLEDPAVALDESWLYQSILFLYQTLLVHCQNCREVIEYD